MARQFDVFQTRDGDHVLVLQHDLLSSLVTRIVCLVVPDDGPAPSIRALGPVLSLGDVRMRLAPQIVATMTLDELGTLVGNVSHQSDQIIRAFDVMLSGN